MSVFYKELGALADPYAEVSEVEVLGLEASKLEDCLFKMILIREAETAIADLYTAGKTKTPCHLGIGQEGVSAGVCSQLTSQDRLYGTHRSHAQFLGLGGDVKELIAEVMGRDTGCCSGMGGSMHLIDRDNGFAGSVPIVGGTISIAVGAGLAARMAGDGSVGVCFFGDGATEEGTFHESLNLAALYKAPVLFVCENNFYSSHMDVVERQLSDRMARFAEAHKVEARVVDGNDAPEVMRISAELLEICRNEGRPVFLEAITYRWRGHVGPDENVDVGVRRSQESIDAWKKRDPVQRLRKAMEKEGFLGENDYDRICEKVNDLITDACNQAIDAPFPEVKLVHDLVYKEAQS